MTMHAKVYPGIFEVKRVAEHSARNARFAAEDVLLQTKLAVRRRPLQSLAVVFGGGLIIGGAVLYALGVRGWRRP
jgi:hypothetical protein